MTRQPRERHAEPTNSQPAEKQALPILRGLEIRNLATIRELNLSFLEGLSVYTGETGAGKSIIVDALGLLLGSRSNTDLIRTGEEDLLVTGFWGDQTASRRVSLHGRGMARLDGEVVSLREMQEWSTERLTIHWQHSAVSLLSSANQRALLDRQLPAEAGAYAAAYSAWQTAQTRLERLKTSERERARQLDLLNYQSKEIGEVSPKIGEEEPLQVDLKRLANLETIAQGAAQSLALLTDGEENALGFLAEALRALNSSAKYDETSAQLQGELREALDNIQAVIGELRSLAEDEAPDPEELARVEARLGALGKLRTKYGPTLEDVLAFSAASRRRVSCPSQR